MRAITIRGTARIIPGIPCTQKQKTEAAEKTIREHAHASSVVDLKLLSYEYYYNSTRKRPRRAGSSSCEYCVQGGGKPSKKQQDRYECSLRYLRYTQPITTGTILSYNRSKTNKPPFRLLLTHKDPQNARDRRTTTGDSSNDSPNSPGSTKLPITKCACGRYRHATKRGWTRAIKPPRKKKRVATARNIPSHFVL